MSIEAFNAKFEAELVELALQSSASVAGESRGLSLENQTASQEGASEVSTARKLSGMLNYVLDLSDYNVMGDVSINACIVQCIL